MLCRMSVLSVSAALCASAQPAFPETPAGRTLKAWFEAFNSGDRARLEAYIQKFDPSRPIDNQMNFRNQTGGFDLVSIDKSERTHIESREGESRLRHRHQEMKDVGRDLWRQSDTARRDRGGIQNRALSKNLTEPAF